MLRVGIKESKLEIAEKFERGMMSLNNHKEWVEEI